MIKRLLEIFEQTYIISLDYSNVLRRNLQKKKLKILPMELIGSLYNLSGYKFWIKQGISFKYEPN